jgi:CheY-like chemotaxis protein
MSDVAAHGRRVLVVEDVKALSKLMLTLLKNRGYVVELAEDGDTCLQKAKSFSPELILLDIMMPKMHGIDVLKKLKEEQETRSIGVIVCTAKNFKTDLDQVRALGAADVIVKPFEKDHFLRTIERFFAGPSAGEFDEASLFTPGSTFEPHQPQIPAAYNFVRFFGTRGSIPVSGPSFVRHGGNTSCAVIGRGDDMVIIDAGSGIREIGLQLIKGRPRTVHLLISHTHWDHIQGFPFFAPLFVPGFEVIIYGASSFGKDLKSVFRGQLDRDYFPVQFDDMRAKVHFENLHADGVKIGDLKISWEFTHHPTATVGFKVESKGKTVGYVTDNEFLQGYLGSPRLLSLQSTEIQPHEKLLTFLTGVDLLIHEAQYTNEEYVKKVGWGHTSLTNACVLASLSNIKRWIITHHDPLHSDDFLGAKLNLTKEILRRLTCNVEVTHAYDGEMAFF